MYLEPIPDVEVADGDREVHRYRQLLCAQLSGDYTQYREDFLRDHASTAGANPEDYRITVMPNVSEARSLLHNARKGKSTGHENEAKRDLSKESADKDSGRRGLDLSGLPKRLAALLRAALRGQGNFSFGKASRKECDALARAWVGADAQPSSGGKVLISKDGERFYRPPSTKIPNPSGGGKHVYTLQANFQRKDERGDWSNGHLTITGKD